MRRWTTKPRSDWPFVSGLLIGVIIGVAISVLIAILLSQ